jgi:hypothetical protein
MSQEKRITLLATILGEAILDLGEIPNGHLYAQVMGKIDLDSYNGAISVLKDAGLVEETSYALKWVGPTPLDEEGCSSDYDTPERFE